MKGRLDADVNPLKIGNQTSYNTCDSYSNCPNCNSPYISNITKVTDLKSHDDKYELRISNTEYECSKCVFTINNINYVQNEGNWIVCGVRTETNAINIKGDLLGPL